MRFVIVTGVSGAGKTSALKMLEDANYFCVDNLPIPLLEKFASLMPEIQGEDIQNVALGIDARSGRSLDELEVVLDRMKKAGYDFEILFLDAQDSVLVKRYKETRRSHPLAMGGRVVGPGLAVKIVDTFLNTPFSEDERHIRRISQIEEDTDITDAYPEI